MALWEMSAHALADLLRRGEITAVELAKCFLARIDTVESTIGAYITITADEAIAQAETVDRARMRGEALPPLAGIPYALKDNVCTRGILTTCASRMLQDFIPPYDATLQQRLRAQQAVLLGKLNMDEFAMGGTNATSFFHVTRNPHDPDRVPGGSSGGSAAAVAAGEAVFSIGTDTGGSIRQPASYCGIVGLKPSYGRVSRYGVVAFAASLDQAGPMARDVMDVEMVYHAIAGADPNDTATCRADNSEFPPFSDTGDVAKTRIGSIDGLASACDARVVRAWHAARDAYAQAGAIVESADLPATGWAGAVYDAVSSAEAVSSLGRFDGVRFGHRASRVGNQEDIIAASRSEGFGISVKKRLLVGAAVQIGDKLSRARQARHTLIGLFDGLFERFDVLLAPVCATTAPRFDEAEQHTPIDVLTESVNLAGLPAISLPVGRDEQGLPIGMHLIAPYWREDLLFRAAYALEQRMKG